MHGSATDNRRATDARHRRGDGAVALGDSSRPADASRIGHAAAHLDRPVQHRAAHRMNFRYRTFKLASGPPSSPFGTPLRGLLAAGRYPLAGSPGSDTGHNDMHEL